MASIVLSPYNVASFPQAGGHFWVYMQTAAALSSIGCDVYWMEQFHPSDSKQQDDRVIQLFLERMQSFGLANKVLLYQKESPGQGLNFLTMASARADEVIRNADLLLNFHYAMDNTLLARFRRTALVDIDPGLFQFWLANGQLDVPLHHFYFTTGETVGSSKSLFPDCGLPWIYTRPGVFLDQWPYLYDSESSVFTTVSSWWGKEYVSDGKDVLYENNKRVSFLDFIDLPKRTSQPLELALSFGDDEESEKRNLERFGWRVKHAFEIANGPEKYRAYIQGSRGEFSCAKPSCMRFQNAWISDRTLCYLSSGKPAVVQYTGPSSYLPHGEGLFRFSTMEEAVNAFETINADYEKHCRKARQIAEEFFDATKSVEKILNTAL